METSRYLACLRHDAARLRMVAEGHLDRQVPSCPDWKVVDLVQHVAEAYQHKTECIRRQEFPRPWPPDFGDEDRLALFDRSLAELLAEFDKHDPADPAKTWYDADQTVGFWIRRMAQETVIHRVDAELAAGEVTAIPPDLALDGIDEVLAIFLSWDSQDTIAREGDTRSWPPLAESDGRTVEVRAGDRAWLLRPGPSGVELLSSGTETPAATVSGDPVDVLLWLWRRGDAARLTVDGDQKLVDGLHELMRIATQ
jgi:uncharacterized protein (TIGR03083 family)